MLDDVPHSALRNPQQRRLYLHGQLLYFTFGFHLYVDVSSSTKVLRHAGQRRLKGSHIERWRLQGRNHRPSLV